jgi:hypothetical protein
MKLEKTDYGSLSSSLFCMMHVLCLWSHHHKPGDDKFRVLMDRAPVNAWYA